MSSEIKECPKCRGQLIRGFIPDYTNGPTLVGSWHEGIPKKSFWTGVKAPVSGGVPIGVYRCSSCGYLEFYAGPEYGVS